MASKYKLYGQMVINGKNKRIFRIEKSVKNYVIYNKKYIELQKYKKIITDKFKKGGMTKLQVIEMQKKLENQKKSILLNKLSSIDRSITRKNLKVPEKYYGKQSLYQHY